MSITLNVNDKTLDAITRQEARTTIANLALRILQAQTANRGKGDKPAQLAVRQAVNARFQHDLTQVLAEEERTVIAIAQLLNTAKGKQMDLIGGQLGVGRLADEDDATYKERLGAANDLDSKPYRKALGDAIGAMVDTVLANESTIRALIARVAAEVSD